MGKRILDLPRQPRILVVEDSPLLLQLLETTFRKNYIVATAEDGQQGFRMAKASYFDVIISDVDLPEMDGIEFFQALFKHDPGINRRFLFLSGLITRDREEFLDANEVPFFWKPVEMSVLKQKVTEILEENRQRKEL